MTYNCQIRNLSFPSSVTTIGQGAFNYCTQLSSVSIPSNIKALETKVFENCTSLTSATIESSSIAAYAFGGCSQLKTVTLGKRVSAFSALSFYDCHNIEKYVCNTSNFDITKDGRCVVGYDGNLITCAQGSLNKYVIPEKTANYDLEITSIGAYCFYNSKVTEVVVPPKVSVLQKSSFYENSRKTEMKKLYFTSDEPAELKLTGSVVGAYVTDSYPPIAAGYGKITIYVPESALEAYKTAWSRWYTKFETFTDLPFYGQDGNDGH